MSKTQSHNVQNHAPRHMPRRTAKCAPQRTVQRTARHEKTGREQTARQQRHQRQATSRNAPSNAPRKAARKMQRPAHEAPVQRLPPVAPAAPIAPAAPAISRRSFIRGAVGVGAATAIGAGAFALSRTSNDTSGTLSTLSVPRDGLITQNDFEVIDDYSTQVRLRNSFDIPYGTLVWAHDETLAACLTPTETGSPLATISVLSLDTGQLQNVRTEAVSKADGFEILDVRASSAGVVWTESNIMSGAWRVYCAPLANGALGTPALIDESTNVYEIPTLAAVGTRAFLQKIPRDATDSEHNSQLLTAPFESGETTCYYESPRRNASAISADATGVIITPRVDSSSVFYQLTRIDAASGALTDTLVLPQSMRPLEATFGKTGFMFSFPDIYTYGEGISNMGTYVPFALPPDGNYSNEQWFGFVRTPTAPPTWMDNLLIMKSSHAVCGIDLNAHTYFALEVENGADTFGEYLASSGLDRTFVTYTNINHTPIEQQRIYTCRVKVWERA